MSISSFIQYVLDLARKEGKGNVISPASIINWLNYVMLDDFNNLLTQALTLAEQRQVKLANVIFDIKDLRQFVETETLTTHTITTGMILREWAGLPDDFKYELGCTSGMIDVELLSYTLLPKYRGSVINGNPAESPKGFVGGGHIEFIPNDLTDLALVYLRTPAKPYYDFCMDRLDNEIFMPAGSVISPTQVTDHFSLATATGVGLNPDVIRDGLIWDPNIQHAYDSKTIELDWDEINHVRFANMVAHKLGINLKNQILTQTQ